MTPVLDEVGGRLAAPDEEAVLRLLTDAERADGIPPISEQAVHRLRRGELRSVLVRMGGALLAYAAVKSADDAVTAELVVHPVFRGQGHGRRLASTIVTDPRGRPVRAWAHGNLPGAVALAAELGFASVRELRQLRRPAPAGDLPETEVPPGVTVRQFRRGDDDAAWLTLNAAAFADHPEQGRWTAEDLEARLAAPEFEPAGFLVAERDGALVGFHWTKLHHTPHRLSGEVYVLGVHPAAQGTGLGRALLLAGLEVLQKQGVEDVLLYVDADNGAAVRMYERFGFTTAAVDVLYERRA